MGRETFVMIGDRFVAIGAALTAFLYALIRAKREQLLSDIKAT